MFSSFAEKGESLHRPIYLTIVPLSWSNSARQCLNANGVHVEKSEIKKQVEIDKKLFSHKLTEQTYNTYTKISKNLIN